MSIVTHDGTFHADDTLATAILGIVTGKKVDRTRCPNFIKNATYVVDIGEKYNHYKKRYDHHQPNFDEKWHDLIPFSSFGLIWKHYGKEYIKIIFNRIVSPDQIKDIYKHIGLEIDGNDNGIPAFIPRTINYNQKTISSYIGMMNYHDVYNYEKQYECFIKAQQIGLMLINISIKERLEYYENINHYCDIIREARKQHPSIIFINDHCPMWKPALKIVENYRVGKHLYIVHKVNDKYACVCLPVWGKKFVNRKTLPEIHVMKKLFSMDDKTWDDHIEFVHKNRFMMIFKSKNSALKYSKLLIYQN